MSDRTAVLPQYLFPKHAMTVFAGLVANAEAGAVTTEIIRRFVRKYRVNMDEAANPDIASYASFNAFFTRALKAQCTFYRDCSRSVCDAPASSSFAKPRRMSRPLSPPTKA